MNRLRRLIEELQTRKDLGVIEEEQSWTIKITKGSNLICEITVPHAVLEWHASVKTRSDNKEVWSDWMDYLGYDDSPAQKLEAEMADDILAFVNRVSLSESLFPLQIYQKDA